MLPQPVESPLEYVRVVRSGGIAGAIEELHIDKSLRAQVKQYGEERAFHLDAREAEELTVAVNALVARTPSEKQGRGADIYQYDIEIGWGGQVVRIHANSLAADEAIRGVIAAASDLLSAERDDVPKVMGSGMDLHVRAPEGVTTAGVPVPPGIPPSDLEVMPEPHQGLPVVHTPEELAELLKNREVDHLEQPVPAG